MRMLQSTPQIRTIRVVKPRSPLLHSARNKDCGSDHVSLHLILDEYFYSRQPQVHSECNTAHVTPVDVCGTIDMRHSKKGLSSAAFSFLKQCSPTRFNSRLDRAASHAAGPWYHLLRSDSWHVMCCWNLLRRGITILALLFPVRIATATA